MPKSLEEQVDDFKHIVSQLDFIDGQSCVCGLGGSMMSVCLLGSVLQLPSCSYHNFGLFGCTSQKWSSQIPHCSAGAGT